VTNSDNKTLKYIGTGVIPFGHLSDHLFEAFSRDQPKSLQTTLQGGNAMSLFINNNMASQMAQRNLSNSNRSLQTSFERVSSGLRINRAADDSAGFGVAENLSAQSRSATVAIRNTNDGVSVVQTAEGATSEVGSILKRMRELAVQSSSDVLASTERAYIQDEFAELTSEVDRIANVTEFNGKKLTNADNTSLAVQVGVNNSANDRISITLGDLTASTLGVKTADMSMNTVASARAAIAELDTALDTVNGYHSDYGATQNRLGSALSNVEVYRENLISAESQIRDADFAFETAELSKNQIMQQAGLSILAQAKVANQGVLNLL
jgi:flagellin